MQHTSIQVSEPTSLQLIDVQYQDEPFQHQQATINNAYQSGNDGELNHFTYSTPDLQELHTIIKAMRNNASSGPDGLNAAFYKSAWNWVSPDIHQLVSEFYRTAYLSPELNQTYITLIPKKMQPIIPQDF